jgi:hypothetical protein
MIALQKEREAEERKRDIGNLRGKKAKGRTAMAGVVAGQGGFGAGGHMGSALRAAAAAKGAGNTTPAGARSGQTWGQGRTRGDTEFVAGYQTKGQRTGILDTDYRRGPTGKQQSHDPGGARQPADFSALSRPFSTTDGSGFAAIGQGDGGVAAMKAAKAKQKARHQAEIAETYRKIEEEEAAALEQGYGTIIGTPDQSLEVDDSSDGEFEL